MKLLSQIILARNIKFHVFNAYNDSIPHLPLLFSLDKLEMLMPFFLPVQCVSTTENFFHFPLVPTHPELKDKEYFDNQTGPPKLCSFTDTIVSMSPCNAGEDMQSHLRHRSPCL